jgi:hypothetical protein
MSHVLAYNLSPRARAFALRDDDVLSPEDIAKLNLVDVVVGERPVETEPLEVESEADLARKKEIEELIKKYSGLTYTPSTAAIPKTGAVAPAAAAALVVSDNNNEGGPAPRVTDLDEGHNKLVTTRSRLNLFNGGATSNNVLLTQNQNGNTNTAPSHSLVNGSGSSLMKSSSNYGSLFNALAPSASTANLPADRSYAKVLRTGNGKENYNSVIHNANVSGRGVCCDCVM